jgi:hypothetical protein
MSKNWITYNMHRAITFIAVIVRVRRKPAWKNTTDVPMTR